MSKIQIIKIIPKTRFSHTSSSIEKFWGIKIYDEGTKKSYSPVYPFAEEDNLAALEEFIGLYEKDLLDFYMNGWNYSFGRFFVTEEYKNTKYGISRDLDLSIANRFRDRWFKKGVVFY